MADNTQLSAGTADGVVIATDDVSSVHYQRVKLVDGTLNSTDAIAGDATNGLDVDVTRLPSLVAGTALIGKVSIDQVTANANEVVLKASSANIGDVDVLTVPAPLSTTGGGTEATALRVTVATDSTGVLSVDDNGAALTIDSTQLPAALATGGGLKVTVQDTAGSTLDLFHSGDTYTAAAEHGLMILGVSDETPSKYRPLSIDVAGSDGESNTKNRLITEAYLSGYNGTTWDRLRSDTTNGLDVDVTRLPALVAGTANIGDVDVLTVPAPLSTAGAGTEATALRVTLATDSTGQVKLAAGTAEIGKLAAGTALIGKVGIDQTTPGTTNRVDIGTIAAGTTNIGDVDVLTVPADPFGANADAASATGSISAKLRFIASTGIPVTGTVTVGSHAVTNAGTFATQPAGSVADDGITPPNPIMIGGKAVETDGTDPTSVSAEDDVAICRTDRNRRLLVSNVHPRLWKSIVSDHNTAQTNHALVAAPGANLALYITDIIISNGATAGSVKLVEDEAGTPAEVLGSIYLAINGGAVINLVTPIKCSVNKSLGFTSTSVTTHTVQVHGFTAP